MVVHMAIILETQVKKILIATKVSLLQRSKHPPCVCVCAGACQWFHYIVEWKNL